MLKLKTNKKSGITLISLVVTIIVLLLLAGISIMMLTGNNGILQRANEAKVQTIISQEQENVELAYITADGKKKLGDDVTAKDLQDALDAMLGDTEEVDETKKKTNVKQNSNNTISVLFRETQHSYIINNGKVEKALEDGIYVGDVKMAGLYLPDFSGDESHEDYWDSVSDEEQTISLFFQSCYEKEATSSAYENAIECAERVGISREWLDYAYNNQGDRVSNLQAFMYGIEPINRQKYDIGFPLTADIIGYNNYFNLDLNLDIQYKVTLVFTDDPQAVYTDITMNPECISVRYSYADTIEQIPDEVQLPFGMVLKKDETLIQTLYEQYINWTSSENALNIARRDAFVIEWQGQTFTIYELRAYFLNNTKIVYNGQTLNIKPSNIESITSPTSGEEIDNLLGIDFADLYITGYLDELNY